MEIIIGLVIVFVVIRTLAFLRGDSYADDEYERWVEFNDFKSKIAKLEIEKKQFQEQMMIHCASCNKNFYSKDLKQLEISNSLKSVISNLEQIVKKV